MYEARLRSCATCSVNGREEQLWSQSSPVALCRWEEEAAGKATGEEVEKGDEEVQGKEGASKWTSHWPIMFVVLALLTIVLALVLGQVAV